MVEQQVQLLNGPGQIYRQSAARFKERKMQYISEPERKVQTLQSEATVLSEQLTLLQPYAPREKEVQRLKMIIGQPVPNGWGDAELWVVLWSETSNNILKPCDAYPFSCSPISTSPDSLAAAAKTTSSGLAAAASNSSKRSQSYKPGN